MCITGNNIVITSDAGQCPVSLLLTVLCRRAGFFLAADSEDDEGSDSDGGGSFVVDGIGLDTSLYPTAPRKAQVSSQRNSI